MAKPTATLDRPATAPAPTELSYDVVPVPESTRGIKNPHLDKVRELNTSRLNGQARAAAFVVPADKDQKSHDKAVARSVRYLQEAGQSLDITVRKIAEQQPDKSTKVTFWTVEKIRRGKGKDTQTAGATPAPVAG